jgi:hypothetical protein
LNDKATRAAIEKSKHPNLPHSDADPYVREWKEEFVKQRYYVTNFEIDVAAVLGQLSHRASYNESGSGSIDVTKYTISSTGRLGYEVFPLRGIHAKSPGVSHFPLYNARDHYNCAKNITPLAKAKRKRTDKSTLPSAITDKTLEHYATFVRSACAVRLDETVIEVPTGAGGACIPLKGRGISRLGPGKWLNDEVVNCCAELINTLSKGMYTGGTASLKFGIANSFFLPKFLNYGKNMGDGPLQGGRARQVFYSFGKLSSKQLGNGSSITDFDVLVVPVVDFHFPEKLG